MIYHIYPVKSVRWLWKWNLDQIIQRIELFNGRRIIGIAHDNQTDHPDAVKEYLKGYDCEFIVEENITSRSRMKQPGENLTAVKMMESVQSFEPELTFRAHAKGVTKRFGEEITYRHTSNGHHTENGEPVKVWTEMMYAICLDDWQSVRKDLEQYAMTGPYRRHNKLASSNWFYSGSFYWYEHTRFYQRNWRDIDPLRIGVESLPGRLFSSSEVGCLHGDDCGSLYHQKYIDDKAWPEFLEWQKTTVPNRVLAPGKLTPPRHFSRFSGTLSKMLAHAESNPSDINEHVHSLRSLAQQCEHVTEFGVRCGVSTVAFLGGKPKTMRSYDINVPPNIDTLRGVVPPETDWKFTVADTLKIDMESTDMLFIDTLHEHDQLAHELDLHGNKSRKYLVFHDTVTFGDRGELGGGGLNKAIEDFQRHNPHWVTMADFKNCNGLKVLRREN